MTAQEIEDALFREAMAADAFRVDPSPANKRLWVEARRVRRPRHRGSGLAVDFAVALVVNVLKRARKRQDLPVVTHRQAHARSCTDRDQTGGIGPARPGEFRRAPRY